MKDGGGDTPPFRPKSVDISAKSKVGFCVVTSIAGVPVASGVTAMAVGAAENSE